MGLLIRSVAGLSLLFLALPIDVSGETTGEEPVSPLQTIFAARDALADIASLCERQPDVCATAKAAIATIIARAKESVRMAQSLSGEAKPETQTPHPEPREPVSGEAPEPVQ
ncbi:MULTISPECIES: DUF5330 domain-containing protein [Chelativorans]|jgi:hypothetical protein|uniref:Uncharacterized protein n=1 Tax=Chelativorans sp. (strain BNC1) TaxID=266779 RepID=Q11JZ9_CHESB|nr:MULTISPECIES: DUF5330 domain-containing protein [Chelativorans]